MVEVILPINYYQDTAAAPDGKYNIVVSCSTSAYGDYMDACTTNVMYVVQIRPGEGDGGL